MALPPPAAAKLVFVSTPPGEAHVGQLYTYKMAATDEGADDGDNGGDTGSSGSGDTGTTGSGSGGSGDTGTTGSGSGDSGDTGTTGSGSGDSGDTGTTGSVNGDDGSGTIGETGDGPSGDGPNQEQRRPGRNGREQEDDTAPLVFSAPTLPSWLKFDNKDTIAGTPSEKDVGTTEVVVAVSNKDSTVQQSFPIDVIPLPNSPPFLLAPILPSPQSTTEGVDYRFDVSVFFRDLDGDALSYTATGLPAGLAIDAQKGVISGKPSDGAAANSPYTVTVAASDGYPMHSPASGSFNLIVAAANHPPQLSSPISPDPQDATEGDDYRFDVSKFFSDPDGDKLSFKATGLPPGLSIDSASGIIAGKLGPADVSGGAVTPYTIGVTASDGQASASPDSYTLNVHVLNKPPTLPDPAPKLSTPEDTPLTITPAMLNASDEAPATLAVLLTPPGADAHFSLSGGTTVKPAANYDGPLQVEARVKDAGGLTSNAVKVAIDVTPVNDAPSIKAIPDQSATEDVAFSLKLADFVSDAEGDPITYRATDLPPGLSLDSASGAISGTPPIGTPPGDYDVKLAVNDGAAASQADFHIKIVSAGRADLSATVSVSPNPVLVGKTATWTISVTNNGTVQAANVDLSIVFSSDVPLSFDPAPASCSLQAQDKETDVSCKLGPLAGGASATITVTGSASEAGQISAAATAGIADPVPIDDNPDNDTARAALDVTKSLSDAPAEQLDAPGADAVAAGDFNGDGLADLAVATKSGQGTLVFLNAADPDHTNKLAFPNLPLTFADAAAETGIAAADLDGDGDIDLAVARSEAPDGVLINGGQADFQASALGDAAAASNAVAIADLNGDGLPDLVFANNGASTVYINNGGGAFTPQTLAGTANSVGATAVDLNGDALPDIVLANADGSAELYVNSGGSFAEPAKLDTGPATAVAAQDFNGDGLPDLVFGQAAGDSPANGVYLNTSASNPATLSFFEAAELGGVHTADVLAADFDLDGLNDVITINGAGGHELYTNAGGANTAFLLHSQQFVTNAASKAVAGQFNADTRLDVAVAGGDKVDVFFNDGRGNFGPGDVDAPTLTLTGQASVTVTVGDDYTDAGATASDPEDGDLTSKITVDNPVDTSVIGTYTVTYNVVDNSGNAAAPIQRSVEVEAREAEGGGGGGGVSVDLGLLALAALSAVRRRGKARKGSPAAGACSSVGRGPARSRLYRRSRGCRP